MFRKVVGSEARVAMPPVQHLEFGDRKVIDEGLREPVEVALGLFNEALSGNGE
jgi:hypothetical protein